MSFNKVTDTEKLLEADVVFAVWNLRIFGHVGFSETYDMCF